MIALALSEGGKSEHQRPLIGVKIVVANSHPPQGARCEQKRLS